MTTKVLFKKLHERAVLPVKDPGNAAYDLVIPDQVTLLPFTPILVDLGFATEFPEGWWANIKPRSSSLPKRNLLVCEGVVDASYRGTWKLSLLYLPPKHDVLVLSPGDRVAQVVFSRVEDTVWEETEGDLEETSRGARGFGEGTGL